MQSSFLDNIKKIHSLCSYLLAYLLNFTTPCISVTAAPIGSQKIGRVGGHMVSKAPGPDRNRSGGKGLFGPPKNKKCYISDFFFSKTCLDFWMILIMAVNKN